MGRRLAIFSPGFKTWSKLERMRWRFRLKMTCEDGIDKSK
jgi:hypothetical protein